MLLERLKENNLPVSKKKCRIRIDSTPRKAKLFSKFFALVNMVCHEEIKAVFLILILYSLIEDVYKIIKTNMPLP